MRIVTDAASKPGRGVSEASSHLYRSTCFGVVAAFVAPAVCIEGMPDIERSGEADEAAGAVPSRRCILSKRFSAGASMIGDFPGASFSPASVATRLANGLAYASKSGMPRIDVATTLLPVFLTGTSVHTPPSFD